MATLIKLIILALVALVVFFKSIFTSTVLYWLAFVLAFALVPAWWVASYWVSEKKAEKAIGEKFEKSFFVGMVSTADVQDDLIRGRLCICAKEIKLVVREKNKYTEKWSEQISEIQSSGCGKVAGVRNGFTIYTKEGETAFVTRLADEAVKAILKS